MSKKDPRLARIGATRYNQQVRTPKGPKKFAKVVKRGDRVKLVRYGDPNMTIKKSNPKRRKSFRSRHKCETAKDPFTARYQSCKNW